MSPNPSKVTPNEASVRFYDERAHDTRLIFGDRSFINFGFWQRSSHSEPLTLDDRQQASKRLYDETVRGVGLEILTKGRVLEFGCGTAGGIVYLAEKTATGVTFVGVDDSTLQIERGRLLAQPFGDRIKLSVGHSFDAGVGDSEIDIALSVEAIQHFPNPQAFATELKRVLKVGGKVAIASFFVPSPEFVAIAKSLIPENEDGRDNAVLLPQFVDDLRDAGFEVKLVLPIGEHVFPSFAEWARYCGEDWVTAFYSAYQRGALNYFVLQAQKI